MSFRRRLARVGKRLAGRAGYVILPRDDPRVLPDVPAFYGPVPDVGSFVPDHFDRPHPVPGVDIDVQRGFAFLEDSLARHIATFDAVALRSSGWYQDNSAYEAVDSELLHAMVRHHEPRRIVEIGAGFTTLVIESAIAASGGSTAHEVIDPHPHPVLPERITQRLVELPAQAIPPRTFEALGRNDILFIDSTHVVKSGSDVNRLLLEVLPALSPGVVVHLHDIFLPFEYHRAWVSGGPYWNEQYLLQAFLSMNPGFEVTLPTHAMFRTDADRLRRAIPSLRTHQPTSFWMRRTDADGERRNMSSDEQAR
jgi:hypothetical protein